MTGQELAAYRAPFPTAASRRSIWRFPNELPLAGSPAAYAALKESTYPKLLFAGDPGAQVSPRFARELVATLTNAQLVELGAGRHYLQEDHGPRIGTEVADWLRAQ